MFQIPLVTGIANAAASLTGTHGAVTRQAQAAVCSRQTVSDQAQKVPAAVVAEHQGGPTRAELLQQNGQLRQEDAPLGDWLAQTIEFPLSLQHEVTVTATAMGLSLNQVLVLLALILGTKACPGRSTGHRGIQAAGIAAGRVLKHLDARCRALVPVGGLDEIFSHRRPVLVGVEPASLVWSLGQKADDRTGETWAKALPNWSALQYVTADAGTGLQAGIAAVPQQRHAHGQPALEDGLDVFHTVQEAQRVLRAGWDRVERTWEPAEGADRRVEQAQRQGQDARGAAVAARHAWKRVEAAFGPYERGEAAWNRAHAALGVFPADGRLNDRVWATAQIGAALPGLSGREWSQVRGSLQAATALTFLDRLHRQWEAAVPAAELREELVQLWWLRRQRPRPGAVEAAVGAGHVAHLVQQVVCQKRDANWSVLYRAVARVLRQAVRARSAVECRNSVLRRHRGRHRSWTQGLLDLKRLYGNCRAFRSGKRRGRGPYEHLGLDLPSSDFWSLLRDEMSTVLDEEKVKAKGRSQAKPKARAA